MHDIPETIAPNLALCNHLELCCKEVTLKTWKT